MRRLIAAGIGMAAAAAMAPASASAAGVIVAYEHYVTGQGFQIGLKNAATGANIALPAGVNTADDEMHPALSRDGRRLSFIRMRLLPALNGDIVPPEGRSLVNADRQTGAVSVTSPFRVAGPAFVRGFQGVSPPGPRYSVSEGRGPTSFNGERSFVSRHTAEDASGNFLASVFNFSRVPSEAGLRTEVTHGAVDGGPTESVGRDRLMLGLGLYNPTTGAIAKSIVQLVLNVRSSGGSVQVLQRDFGSAEAPAAHPMTRGSDETVAFAQAPGGDYGIVTTTLPKAESGTFAVPDPTAAPAAINTAAPEQMPAWSPDDLKLAFVRTTAGRRGLALFDATPGIQTVLNSPFDLGPEAPTPQTRAIQSLWGGISLAEVADAAPTPTCTQNCLLTLANTNLSNTVLRPVLTRATTIGIFVARVTGTRRLLGRRVPRLRPVGRVPLGRARRGANRFRWNGKVAGKRLRPGTYLLTFRTLRGKRITNTSNSVRFRVTKGGKIRAVRRQR